MQVQNQQGTRHGGAVIKATEHEDYEEALHGVLGFTDFSESGPKKFEYIPMKDDSFPSGMTISPNQDPQWTENLDAILFGIHEIEKNKQKDEDKKENGNGPPIPEELDPQDTPDVVILEKEADVADGTSKANNAEVHSGIGEKHGTLKQKLNVRGNRMYDEFVEGLGVDFKRQGLLIVVTPRSLPDRVTGRLPGLRRQLLKEVVPRLIILSGKRKGIPGQRIVEREEIFRMEPNVTRDAIVGVHDPTYGLVSPYKLTVALAEHAIINGAKLFLDTTVTGVRVNHRGQRGRSLR